MKDYKKSKKASIQKIFVTLVLLILCMVNIYFHLCCGMFYGIIDNITYIGFFGLLIADFCLFLSMIKLIRILNKKDDCLKYLIVLNLISFVLCLLVNHDGMSSYYFLDSAFLMLLISTIFYLVACMIFKTKILKQYKKICVVLFVLFVLILIKPTDLNRNLYSHIGAKISGFTSSEVYEASIEAYNKDKNWFIKVPYLYKLNKEQLKNKDIIVQDMNPNEFSQEDFLEDVLMDGWDVRYYISFNENEQWDIVDLSSIKRSIHQINHLNADTLILYSTVTNVHNSHVNNVVISTAQNQFSFDGNLQKITVADGVIDFGKSVDFKDYYMNDYEEESIAVGKLLDYDIENIRYENLNLTIYDKDSCIKTSGKLEYNDKLVFTRNNKEILSITVED